MRGYRKIMSDDWDFYPLRVDDQPASIFLDLGIAKIAPIKSHLKMAYLRIQMRKPRKDGLSSQNEFDTLIALEDQVTAKIILDGANLFVGRNTSSGNRDFYFYIRDSNRFEDLARDAMGDFPTYQFETGAREDPDWQTYFEFLYPSDRSMQLIMNRRVLQQLEQNGDNLANERLIDHLVFLPNFESQMVFATGITDAKFIVDDAPKEVNGNGQLSVLFSRIDCPEQIDAVVLPLFDRVTDLGGNYDGWGCEIAP